MVGNSHTAGRGLFEESKEMQSIGGSVLTTEGGRVERGEGKVTVSHGYSEKVT